MIGSFESPEWHSAIAEVMKARHHDDIAERLIAAIEVVVDHEGTCLLAFHRNARPEVLHHTLEPAGAKHYLDRYLDGPYLLDPLYQLAMDDECPSLCRFRERTPDRFKSSEYYRQYCESTHLHDEMDFMLPVDESTTLALVVGRRSRRFGKAELRSLELIEPEVLASFEAIWNSYNSGKQTRQDPMHDRLIECFNRFGEAKLTERERQISQLLLRGHSSKSVARELDIAPGTVMVHKRNMFAKLDISSQYELFSLFIDELGKSPQR